MDKSLEESVRVGIASIVLVRFRITVHGAGSGSVHVQKLAGIQ